MNIDELNIAPHQERADVIYKETTELLHKLNNSSVERAPQKENDKKKAKVIARKDFLVSIIECNRQMCEHRHSSHHH